MTQKNKIMEKKRKTKNEYSAISIKKNVAVRFRRYSKQFSRSNSEVLHRMLFFLQWNGIDPFGNSVEKIVSELKQIRKQIEYLISIIKNMEKLHIKPTHEMVKILFEAYCKNKKEVKKERSVIPSPIIVEAKDNYLKLKHERLESEFKEYKNECRRLLEKIEVTEPTFGKPYLKVHLSEGEYEKLRRQLNED